MLYDSFFMQLSLPFSPKHAFDKYLRMKILPIDPIEGTYDFAAGLLSVGNAGFINRADINPIIPKIKERRAIHRRSVLYF
jgi:hypothetical protein